MYNYNSERGGSASLRPISEPLLSLRLWPNRSLSQRGFLITMALICLGLAIPIFPLMNSSVGFTLIPFAVITFATVFLAIKVNYREGNLYETLDLWDDSITVTRYNPNGSKLTWNANPYWIKVKLYKEDARIQNYLTISGNGREIELGAFLAPNEREEIKAKIESALNKIKKS